ncbi:PhzF family phenazine biosynthesis protein [Litoribacillus peritrichatus]|uniref:PhzF family phenazine biosynthesis protein n=1 Tax=Litoribacillus peritrichatus TaxID=718191 RepID=A0ABP7N2V4_9GAMM
MELHSIKAKLVDVFASSKLAGNGLTIFWNCSDITEQDMLSLTREMRQFESIFVLSEPGTSPVRARIFTMEEELDFAGHPLIGLAAHLHEEYGSEATHHWTIQLNKKQVEMISTQQEGFITAEMNQGTPEFLGVLDEQSRVEVFNALNLPESSRADMPCQVVSTGLDYLIVPITSGIEHAKISIPDFEALLEQHKAKFVYVLDINTFEGRTWNNEGTVEDIATGSAAGPAAAFLHQAGLVKTRQSFQISQGRFVSRPSKINCLVSDQESELEILISGDVHSIANIHFSS